MQIYLFNIKININSTTYRCIIPRFNFTLKKKKNKNNNEIYSFTIYLIISIVIEFLFGIKIIKVHIKIIFYIKTLIINNPIILSLQIRCINKLKNHYKLNYKVNLFLTLIQLAANKEY